MALLKNLYMYIHDPFFNQTVIIKKENHNHLQPSMSASIDSSIPPLRIVWESVIVLTVLHIWALYGLLIMNWRTFLAATVFAAMSILGVTAGAHRFWSHRSFKAKLPLRILLMILQTFSIQHDIYQWSRDHRLHHKHTETNADPHNSKRGLFFAHIGWLMVRKHPDVKEKGKTIDMSDVWADPVVRFQRKHYHLLVTIFSIVIPTMIPVVLWQENFWDSLSTCFFYRYILSLHLTWLINSVAHTYGNKPYDRFISPTDSRLLAAITYGGGYHNFHHTFPCDYTSSEYGWKYNFTTAFIDFMAWLGLAYDLKKTSIHGIQKRKERTGNVRNESNPLVEHDFNAF